ncbi:AIM24 family protein [Rhabdothermincola salaria]|uniref:AIM24 family protein n=1 Tax=Rhabdothermincola salaria TaxID=2903142 RepID=UPI001E30DA8D|nr:AIM24 family protein [Rhabdothermincola salaria]
MAIHADFTEFKETTGADPFTLQNKKLLKVFLQYGPVKARIGSMVAYQGDASFGHAGSGGMSGYLKQKVTREGVPIMDVTGSGEVFLADQAAEIQIIYLENDSIWCNGSSVLAFSGSIGYDIKAIGGTGAMAGGRYNVVLTGTGYVAITSDGPPVVLDVASAPTFVDPQAVVMWTNGVQMSLKSDVNLKTLIGKSSGETFQMAFSGEGWVMVQPSEGVERGAGTKSGLGF